MASRSASANRVSILGVAFQATRPSAFRKRMASNLGDPLRFWAVKTLILDVLVFDIDPEPKNSRYPGFHRGLGFDGFRHCRSEISAATPGEPISPPQNQWSQKAAREWFLEPKSTISAQDITFLGRLFATLQILI